MSPDQLVFLSAFLAAAGFLCLVVAIFVGQTRAHIIGARSLVVLLLALSFWDLTYALFWADAWTVPQSFWLDLTYVGVVIVPVALFVFALQVAQLGNWLNRRVILLLFVEPILVLILLFTDPWHDLFYAGNRSVDTSAILSGGPVFWMNILYSYTLTLVATVLLVRKRHHSVGIYRRQLSTVLFGIGVTWLTSILSMLGFNLLPGVDTTPFSFSVAVAFFAYAIFRHRFLDVVPVARELLVDRMQDGLVVLDASLRLLDINPAARTAIDPTGQWQIGQVVQPHLLLRANLIEKFLQETDLQTEIQVNQDPPRHLALQISPLHDDQGNLLGRMVTWHDITHRKQTLAQLEQRVAQRTEELATANERLMELDHMKDEFISRISHELRTPLTNVKLYLHLLGQATPEKQAIYLDTIRQQSDQLQRLVEDLLSVSYFGDLDGDVAWEAVDVNELIRQLIRDHQTRIEDSKVDLVLSLNAQTPTVRGEAALLRQAISNLLINAYAYAPGSQVTVGSSLHDRAGQPWAQIWVQDGGAGLTDEDKEHIFERFYRGSATQNYDVPGIGVGLSLAKAIITKLDGEIDVESEWGHGATFRLWLHPASK